MLLPRVPTKILCVCLGNICRSPTAEVVLRHCISSARLPIQVDSAGTSNYHPDAAPDSRSIKHAAKRGYDLTQLRARQVQLADFVEFDLVLAMDHTNLQVLLQLHKQALYQYPHQPLAEVCLYSQFDPHHPQHAVPDPYYGDAADFEQVLDQCYSSAQAWVRYWQG